MTLRPQPMYSSRSPSQNRLHSAPPPAAAAAAAAPPAAVAAAAACAAGATLGGRSSLPTLQDARGGEGGQQRTWKAGGRRGGRQSAPGAQLSPAQPSPALPHHPGAPAPPPSTPGPPCVCGPQRVGRVGRSVWGVCGVQCPMRPPSSEWAQPSRQASSARQRRALPPSHHPPGVVGGVVDPNAAVGSPGQQRAAHTQGTHWTLALNIARGPDDRTEGHV